VTKDHKAVLLLHENSHAGYIIKRDSRWMQSKEINSFATVFHTFRDWQGQNDLPKHSPKYHDVRQNNTN